MADIILRKTFGDRDDILLYDDDSVKVNGAPAPGAVVSYHEGTPRIALDPATPNILQVNDVPEIARIRVVREEGWQDALGWRASLLDIKEGGSPGVIALAVYSGPEAQGYLFTTGAFVYNTETELWEAVCPAGFEPGQADAHFSMLYASIKYSAFSLWADRDEITIITGGDLAV